MKFVIGKLYQVEFLDHAMGTRKAILINTVGWCIKDDKDYAVFSAWKVIDTDKDLVENNQEPFVVVKSCIKKKRTVLGF